MDYIIIPSVVRVAAIQPVASVCPVGDHRKLRKDTRVSKTGELEGVDDEFDAGQNHTPPSFFQMYTEHFCALLQQIKLILGYKSKRKVR
jgi:hypothetical protein